MGLNEKYRGITTFHISIMLIGHLLLLVINLNFLKCIRQLSNHPGFHIFEFLESMVVLKNPHQFKFLFDILEVSLNLQVGHLNWPSGGTSSKLHQWRILLQCVWNLKSNLLWNILNSASLLLTSSTRKMNFSSKLWFSLEKCLTMSPRLGPANSKNSSLDTADSEALNRQ